MRHQHVSLLGNLEQHLVGLKGGMSKKEMLKEKAFYKIDVQMLPSGVSLCFYISVARIEDHFLYFINLHVPEEAQSLFSQGESQTAEALYQHELVSISTTAACWREIKWDVLCG